jgi:hypothetical protein
MGTATLGRQVTGSHLAVIDALASELRLPVEQVTGAYFEEIARLEADARIKTFVPVLAAGKVRSRLQRRRPSQG